METAPQQPAELVRDPATGLAGVEAVRARLGDWLGQGRRVQAILIGLRRLAAVNLAFGPASGDAALGEVAARIRHFAAAELDGPWLAARTGGGQFLLIASQPCSREHWQLVCGQLLGAIGRPLVTAGGTIRLSARGALLRAPAGEDAESILDRLAQTLDSVLAAPARRLAWADGETARIGRSAALLEADLLRALEAGEIEIAFQPQFACAGDALIGAEALARWNHPALGRIGAGALFAIAERADQSVQLSRHIARMALAHASDWPAPLRLSLNVMADDLAAPDFAEEMLQLVDSQGPGPGRLTLEVTEQALLADVTEAARILERLAALGIRLALDDFGAGFCNFRYLKLLPLDYLKLDRSMIDGIAASTRDLAVFRGITAMARALGLALIAEGVESEDQRAIIAAEGCAAYQGFLRSPPITPAEFAAMAGG